MNLARALVEAGKRVLVIDSDPQSSLSIVHGLGPRRLREQDATGKAFYYGLVKPASAKAVNRIGSCPRRKGSYSSNQRFETLALEQAQKLL